jgi:acyl-CoA synthetase (AMP-forming)/AMP-acid ligase II
MNIQFADAWECVAENYPNRTAVVCDGVGVSWRDYEVRASKIAALLAEAGLSKGAKVGLYLKNCNEYHEAQFGVLKVGGCPINVNYRYKADELVYLLDNADAEAIFYQASYAMRIWEIKDRLPKVKLFVQVNDGTEALMDFAIDYERSMRDHQPLARQERDPDGLYMFYTGGTTGLPKGVMYPVGAFAEFFINMGAATQALAPPSDLSEYDKFLASVAVPPITVVGCPLMHGTGMWLGGFLPHLLGGTSVVTSKLGLDPDLLWDMVETQCATDLVIVGDAFARPLLEALDGAKARGTPYDLSSLKQISSSGVMWSEEVKQGLLAHHDMVLADIMGSTEGSMGSSMTTRQSVRGTAKFDLSDGVSVITEDDRFVQPGSGEIGRIATSAFVPIGYYKDEAKSAETFREVDGVRYSFPGDFATVEADGSISLLGRGSVCINTAGEKVFPEEVEEVLKKHPGVVDCLVVGIADEKFGQKVVAVVQGANAEQIDASDLKEFCETHLASYKLPRSIVWVPQVQRAPNGKPDYKWALKQAERASQS